MKLTKEQQDILNGSKGETMAKVMKTLVMYGETFDAKRLVKITSDYGHTVISFGIGVLTPVYDLYDEMLNQGIISKQKFSADPLPLDKNVPSNMLQNLVFKIMYKQQERYEKQMKRLGLMNDNAFTCTNYLPQIGNTPKKGDILSWAESSAVVYANSVLGARCNRNSGIIEIMGSVAGVVPEFGLLTDAGRKADYVVEIKTTKKPEAQLLGSAIGMHVLDKVPYVKGLDKFIGKKLDEPTISYLKDFGAATASNGSVGLYHIDKLTPEAVELGDKLIKSNAKKYVIDDAELERVKKNYPVIWKNVDAKPSLCFIGCPHLTMHQLKSWTERIEEGLKKSGESMVTVPTVFTAAPAVLKEFKRTEYADRLAKTGVILSYICPLMYMNNPLCKIKPVITCSNKLRTYTSARYYTEDEILEKITSRN